MKTIKICRSDARRLRGVPAGATVQIEEVAVKFKSIRGKFFQVYYKGTYRGELCLERPDGI